MKFRSLPAIVTLSAALITSIISIVLNIDANVAMWRLFIVVIVFYIIGLIARKIINAFFKEEEIEAPDKEEAQEDIKGDNLDTDEEGKENEESNLGDSESSDEQE